MTERLIARYHEQCEICQAGVSWIQALDRTGAVRCVALQNGPVERIHAGLSESACLAELHVVAPDTGEIHTGWDAVTRIMRVLPALWTVARLDRLPTVRRAADRTYRWGAANRRQLSACRGGACSSVRPADVRRRVDNGAFWSCYSVGLLLRLPLVGTAGHRRDRAAGHRR